MVWLFTIVWILSPFVLIPALIVVSSKRDKLRSFVLALFRAGRIDREEYTLLRLKPDRPTDSTPAPASSLPNPYARRAAVRPVSGSVYGNAVSAGQPRRYNTYVIPPAPPKKSKGDSSFVLLMIGVVFVILAGILFGAAAWLYMSDLRRTGLIALSGAFFFGVSAFSRRKLKLENTSAAFYVLGSVFASITLLTAGYFGLLGDWFSFGGDGRFMLFSAAAITVSAFSFIAARRYHKTVYAHIAFNGAYVALLLMFLQITDEYNPYVLLLCLLSSLLAAIMYFFKPDFGELSRPFERAVKIALVVDSLISLPIVFTVAGPQWGAEVYITFALYALQTAIYGVIKKNKILTGASALLAALIPLNPDYGVSDAGMRYVIIGAVLLVLAAVYAAVKPLRSGFSDHLYPIFLAFDGAYAAIFESSCYAAAIIFLMLSALVIALCLENTDTALFRLGAMRALSAVPPTAAVFCMAEEMRRYEFEIYFCFAAIFCIAAAVFSLCPKLKERTAAMHVSFSFGAALMTISAIFSTETSVPGLIVCIFLCAALFAVCMTSKNNVLSAFPALILYINAYVISENYWDVFEQIDFIAFSAVFAVLCVCSRCIFSKRLCDRDNAQFILDTPALCAALAPLMILTDVRPSDGEMWKFIAFGELSLFSLNLYRSGNRRKFNLFALTSAAAFACGSLYVQPFFDVENEMISSKLDLIPLLLFGVAIRAIWRESKKTVKDLCFCIDLTVLLLLTLDAMVYETLLNTIFVLCVEIAVLLAAFAAKDKRRFVSSAATIVTLTVYAMRDFLSEIDWWVYLLLAGILLISTAAANEYLKTRGESVKSKAEELIGKFKKWG